MSLVHNERTKLTAAWLNAVATALIAAGLFAPLAALLYGLTELRVSFAEVSLTFAGCLAGSLFLHVIGLMLLGRLRE